jgi:hypothetical protein
MRQPHSSTNKGKRVKIKLKTGEEIITKFIETVGKSVRTEAGNYNKGDLKSFTIYKPLH